MFEALFTTLVMVAVPTLQAADDGDSTQTIDGVTIKIESLELTRFHGETSSAIGGAAADLVPRFKRAVVLTTTVAESNEYEAPVLVLANGDRVGLTISGNQLRRGVIQVEASGDENTSIDESWFEIDPELALAEIFPCQVRMGAANERGEMIPFVFRNLSP